MKTNKFNNIFYHSAIIAIAVIAIFIYTSIGNKNDSVNCSALVTYYLHDNYIYDGTVKFSMNNNRGYFAYSGSIKDNSKLNPPRNLLRIIYFHIENENVGDYYRIYNISVKKNVNDAVSEKDFSKIIFDISSGPRKIKIQRLQHELYSIGNVFSPVLMCVADDV